MTTRQVSSLQSSSENSLSLLKTIIDNFPAGMLLLENNRILVANPAAMRALELGPNPIGQRLSVDGQDGPLMEHILGAGKGKTGAKFDYRLHDSQEERTLALEVVLLDNSRMLVRVEPVVASRRVAVRRQKMLAQVFHDLKTPLSVLSLGMSNLSTYYERLSDEDRRAMIDDMAEQVRDLGATFSALFEQMRRGLSGSDPDDPS